MPGRLDGRWKGPLRAALERLASAIDTVAGRTRRGLHGARPRSGRPATHTSTWSSAPKRPRTSPGAGCPLATAEQRERFLDLLEAERWRLAMFASDGWFWDDPIRLETKQVLLCAARAARLIDGAAGTDLESRLVDDLSLLHSPSRRIDGAAIYSEALDEAGQPPRLKPGTVGSGEAAASEGGPAFRTARANRTCAACLIDSPGSTKAHRSWAAGSADSFGAHVAFEFHISKAARVRYEFDRALFQTSGNVIIPDFPAARVSSPSA
jgi:hypothetical protein